MTKALILRRLFALLNRIIHLEHPSAWDPIDVGHNLALLRDVHSVQDLVAKPCIYALQVIHRCIESDDALKMMIVNDIPASLDSLSLLIKTGPPIIAREKDVDQCKRAVVAVLQDISSQGAYPLCCHQSRFCLVSLHPELRKRDFMLLLYVFCEEAELDDPASIKLALQALYRLTASLDDSGPLFVFYSFLYLPGEAKRVISPIIMSFQFPRIIMLHLRQGFLFNHHHQFISVFR